MKIINTVSDMQAYSRQVKGKKLSIAFVPTLGGLHEGHRALMRLGKKVGDVVVVSIFLNPTQFDNKEDLKKYPARREDDLKACEGEGVDCVFLPSVEEMYGDDIASQVFDLKGLDKHLCGGKRPGHFQGVVTIVKKLFEAVLPNKAVFGEKDYQQLQIIRHMVEALHFPIEIIPHPIVREKSGLALSSRNRHLSADEKKEALCLYQALKETHQAFKNGEKRAEKLIQTAEGVLRQSKKASVDYIALVDAATLQPIATLEKKALLALAVFIGPVRLIDNVLLD
ncbi:MAG: pantoate--beta-alanine ligase [Deltaproteobacteria bacterium GWA2_50_8]|nr:MAG: pantoate--beta-alanine ligase [Deltaproteobacteria bacterium GWA2_50_8]